MTITSARRAALSCALLATTAFCGLSAQPAAAQAYTDVERQAPDDNGVDVISGKINVPLRAITAGRAGEGGLSYLSGWAGGENFDTFKVQIGTLGSGVTNVTVMGSRRRFIDNGNGTWSNPDGDGATFTYNAGIDGYVYTARDGTVITFLKSLGDTGFGGLVAARVSTVV
ncbi:MAG TPA: hypothetical protein VF655_13210, partial [Allosphingosinicella sp.]